jgi:RNA 2',3'-cyclic 3'-phosphodiesterase
MAKTRTFIALGASSEVVGHARRIVKRLRSLANDIKWVEPHQLHWTLHFLGEIEDGEIFDLCQALERATADIPEFTLQARGVGAFPRAKAPRTLWIGVGEGTAQMEALYDSIDRELKPLGFRGENRRYIPHLTLGRVGRITPGEADALAAALEELADYEAGMQAIDEVSIFASRLRREGPDYVEIGHAELAG